ncbi:MAG: SsrA-binding protein [Deltaproteobacteria bacterium]|nr:SsrA-binding protein [Deltaproteobacteria bacterium]
MARSGPAKTGHKSIAVNRKARHRYQIEDTYEAGLVLVGSEVKSLRNGKVTLTEGYVRLEEGEAWLVDVHIPPYEQANRENHEPTRPRKLLLHRRELKRLFGKVAQQGYTLVPMQLYFSGGRAKLEVGLGRGKKLHDKRHDEKKRDAKREIDRALKQR